MVRVTTDAGLETVGFLEALGRLIDFDFATRDWLVNGLFIRPRIIFTT